MRYLLVTHIAFARQPDGSVLLDQLWAEDLRGLAHSIGAVTIAAPQVSADALQAWGAALTTLTTAEDLSFIALPVRGGRFDLLYSFKLRRVLRQAVRNADLVHTSNLFEPDTALYFAHDYAVRLRKKTLFVVAEDFADMLGWEWVRPATGPLQRFLRGQGLARTDEAVRRRVRNASLTFLHTPAAVARYRQDAACAIAIRQPVHENTDVIAEDQLRTRLAAAAAGHPLHLVAACRLRRLKGIAFLVRAVAILRDRGIAVRATIYGAGPQRTAIEALAAQLGVADIVALPGAIANGSELRTALNACDVFLMPHLTNDFGRSFFDAMAAGLPVIAFRSVASIDTVRDGVDGLLAPDADAEGLAAAIADYNSDRELLADASYAARRRALDNTRSFWNHLRAGWVREMFANDTKPD